MRNHNIPKTDDIKKLNKELQQTKLNQSDLNRVHPILLRYIKNKGSYSSQNMQDVIDIYNLFIDTFIAIPENMLAEILQYIKIPYYKLCDVMSIGRYMHLRFFLSNYDDTDFSDIKPHLKTKEDKENFFIYYASYAKTNKNDIEKLRKFLDVSPDENMFANYVKKTRCINRNVIKLFASHNIQPNKETIVRMVNKSGDDFMTYMKLLLPDLKFDL